MDRTGSLQNEKYVVLCKGDFVECLLSLPHALFNAVHMNISAPFTSSVTVIALTTFITAVLQHHICSALYKSGTLMIV